MGKITIKELLPDYRPDEKFVKYGADSLTSAELLAIILRTGSSECHSIELAQRILYDDKVKDENILHIYDYETNDLLKIHGVGRVKALQIKAVAELSRRIAEAKTLPALKLSDPSSIADHYMERMRHLKNENVLLLRIDNACTIIKELCISKGTVNASVYSPREIFLEALRYEGSGIILLHNHPSGTPSPSEADINGSLNVRDAGKIIGIFLIDHIIIGDKAYFSFREEGLLNE